MLHSTPSRRGRRGAARISAVWMIVAIVLFLVSIAFAFIAHGDLASERERADAAEAAKIQADEGVQTEATARRELVRLVGWYDKDSANIQTDLETMSTRLEDFKSVFEDLAASDGDIETLLPLVEAAYNAAQQKIASLETEVQNLQNQVTSVRQTTTQVQSDKDGVIADLRQQVADAEQNAASRISDLEGRIATLTAQVSDRDSAVRTVQGEKDDVMREHQRELRALQERIAALSSVTRFAREPVSDKADGKVVETSNALSLGWVDIGADHRLTRGTRFRVEGGTPGNMRFKAMAEVVNVQSNRAEVRFFDVVDRFDPVVAGDHIINPLYDPRGERNAVLVGRFSGAFTEREIRLLLEKMGIVVQDKVDNTTHFLIVGAALWNDPDTNEPLEEPLAPTDLAAYKEAEAIGVQIVPLQDVSQFFRAGSGSN